MRKLLATGAGFIAATAVLWEINAIARVDSMALGAAVVAGVLAGRAAAIGLRSLATAHRHIDGVQADAMAGAPIMYWHLGQKHRDQAILDTANAAQVQL